MVLFYLRRDPNLTICVISMCAYAARTIAV